jgi:hypothetical protein
MGSWRFLKGNREETSVKFRLATKKGLVSIRCMTDFKQGKLPGSDTNSLFVASRSLKRCLVIFYDCGGSEATRSLFFEGIVFGT